MANIKPLDFSELEKIKNRFSPFLKEIKKRIFFIVFVLVLSTVLGFIFNEKIIKFLVSLLPFAGINIVFTSPFQFVNLAIGCGLATGLVVTFPFFILQIISFLKPALKNKEYQILTRVIPFSLFLFLFGLGFGAMVMRWQIRVSLAQSSSLGIGNALDISQLISTVLLTAALMGIGFQFPIILLLLIRLGLISHQQLSKKRLWIYLGSFILILFLPLDSVMADFFLSLPLFLLFELTLLLDRLF